MSISDGRPTARERTSYQTLVVEIAIVGTVPGSLSQSFSPVSICRV
jgi:hypothetical protein